MNGTKIMNNLLHYDELPEDQKVLFVKSHPFIYYDKNGDLRCFKSEDERGFAVRLDEAKTA